MLNAPLFSLAERELAWLLISHAMPNGTIFSTSQPHRTYFRIKHTYFMKSSVFIRITLSFMEKKNLAPFGCQPDKFSKTFH